MYRVGAGLIHRLASGNVGGDFVFIQLNEMHLGLTGDPEIATRIQPQVQTALTRDPSINYVIALYDSAEAPFAVAAINAAGAASRVKVVTFNGTPSVLKMVQDGNVVEIDIGENLDWIARAIMDQHMRLMAGLAPVKDPHIPLRIFDKSNIRDAGTPPRDSAGFGATYVTGYSRLWGLTH